MSRHMWAGLIIFTMAFLGLAYATRVSNTTDTSVVIPGVGGGPGEISSNNQALTPADIRLALEALLPQHGLLATNLLLNLYDGKDSTKVARDLEDNNQQIAVIIEQIGGNKNEFLAAWKARITSYIDYTTALKRNDREQTAKAREDLSSEATQMGQMINILIPSIQADIGKQLMEDHIDLTLSTLEAHARGNRSEQTAQLSTTLRQAQAFANILADGIENR